MENHVSIINQGFRDFSVNSEYPFSPTSTLAASDGRKIPPFAVLDAILYPDDEVGGRVWVYGMRAQSDGTLSVDFMRDDRPWATASVSPTSLAGHVYADSKLVCGTLVFSETGFAYVAGLAKYATLYFNSDGLLFREDRILPIRRSSVAVLINGVQVVDKNSPLTLATASNRFSITTVEGVTSVAFNPIVQAPAQGPGARFTSVNGHPVSSIAAITLRTPTWSNLQMTTATDHLLVHKKGD